jgi:MazG family protein
MSLAGSSEHRTIEDLVALIRTLRGPEGCPWDKSQDLADIKTYLIEECYEVVDAIDQGSFPQLKEELGDLLFHVVFLAYLSQERGEFTLNDVLQAIHKKMTIRHPHVFGDAQIMDVEGVQDNWWRIKKREKEKAGSLLDGIPGSLPALHQAFRLGRRASRVGLDWPDQKSILAKLLEEYRELGHAIQQGSVDQIEDELGDVLFTVANLARSLRINPEEALNRSNQKFIRRFKALEKTALQHGKNLEDLSANELDALWERIK